jgi:hypothetical protein
LKFFILKDIKSEQYNGYIGQNHNFIFEPEKISSLANSNGFLFSFYTQKSVEKVDHEYLFNLYAVMERDVETTKINLIFEKKIKSFEFTNNNNAVHCFNLENIKNETTFRASCLTTDGSIKLFKIEFKHQQKEECQEERKCKSLIEHEDICLTDEQICNNRQDCYNNRDELACKNNNQCQSDQNQWQCNDKHCILKSHLCNGFKDCQDGESFFC